MSTETETAVVDLKSNAVHSVFAKPEPEAPKELVAQVEVEDDDHAESEEASAASDGDDSTAGHKKNRGVGKRINELTREKYEERRAKEEATRRADELERRLAQYEKGASPAAQTQESAKPKLIDFDYDYEAWGEAMADYKAEQKLQERDRKDQQVRAQETQEERSKTVQARIDAYAERDPEGWQRALEAPIKLTRDMVEAIADSDLAPEIGVYLADNLDEADSISRLSPQAQIRAIGRIEAKLEGVPAKTREAPPKKLTSAPPPAKTIKGGSAAIKNIDAEGISTADRIALWRAQKTSR